MTAPAYNHSGATLAGDWETCTPDTPPTGGVFNGLWVGTTGNVSVTSVSGVTKIFKNVASGTPLPVRGTLVTSSGTTATDILHLF
jgi:hypothetical protein